MLLDLRMYVEGVYRLIRASLIFSMGDDDGPPIPDGVPNSRYEIRSMDDSGHTFDRIIMNKRLNMNANIGGEKELVIDDVLDEVLSDDEDDPVAAEVIIDVAIQDDQALRQEPVGVLIPQEMDVDANAHVDANKPSPNQQKRLRGEKKLTALDMENEPPIEGYARTGMIGQGAYGIVYRGNQLSTGTVVAIKRIPFAENSTPEGGIPCNVIREISLLKELDQRNHPNVVKLLDVIQSPVAGLFLVFEFVEFDLKTFIDRIQTSTLIQERKGLPSATVKDFMRQILAGVGFIHTYRVLHRDLKPHNLLISEDGRRLKLADFGLARLSALPNGPYTYEVVTLWYRAPELLLGANRYSAAVDVWSIGCIFAEMMTGLPLFPGRSDIDEILKIFQKRGTPNNETWPSYSRLPHYNREFPQWKCRPVEDYIPRSKLGSDSAADLLDYLLQYDPDKRPTCRLALNHLYFTEPTD